MQLALHNAQMDAGGHKGSVNCEGVLEFALRLRPFGLLRVKRPNGVKDVGAIAAPLNDRTEHVDCFRLTADCRKGASIGLAERCIDRLLAGLKRDLVGGVEVGN